ncbi:MAG: class I SAM-dependent methyltransferase [Candidatus Helarchaeota archaeon]
MKQSNSKANKPLFKEKRTTLSSRIDAHKKFSKLEINDWILKIINLKPGEKILDVGCGTGKQAIPYKKIVGNSGIVIATDISEEILNEAKEKAKTANVSIQFILHDANNPFEYSDGYFDVISCCFAIYYLNNLEKVIKEFKRLLRLGGRIFLAGPTPQNAQLLHDLHKKITKKTLPYMPGKSRFMSEVLTLIQKYFQDVKVEIFKNPLVFHDANSFLEYYTSTGLFLNSVENDNERENLKEAMKIEIQKWIHEKGKIEIVKEVGGIIAYKK